MKHVVFVLWDCRLSYTWSLGLSADAFLSLVLSLYIYLVLDRFLLLLFFLPYFSFLYRCAPSGGSCQPAPRFRFPVKCIYVFKTNNNNNNNFEESSTAYQI